MPVIEKETDVDIIYKVQTGTTSDGTTPTYSSRSIQNINANLSNDDVLAIGNGVASLQIYPVGEISKRVTTILAEQA